MHIGYSKTKICMHISDNEGKDILKGLNNKLIKGNYTIPIVKVHGKRLIFFNVLFLNTLKIIEKLQGQYKDCGLFSETFACTLLI